MAESEAERVPVEETAETATVVAVSAGASHTVALLSDDRVCAWGRGEDGQLGLGSADEKRSPWEVAALKGKRVIAVSCGADHTTAFSDEEKKVWSWGWGDFGRLGHGHSSDVFLPQPVLSLSGRTIRQIACGDCHCVAITSEGEMFGWGRNQNGQLGIGSTEDALVPTEITALRGTCMAGVAAGAEHTAAVAAETGALYSWGWGRYGNLGLGDRADRHVPERVTAVAGEQMVQIACGWRHTVVVNDEGSVFSFGWSKYGQLGHGDTSDHLTPSRIQSLADRTIVQICGGWRHSVALDSAGTIHAWGWNKFGQLGSGTNQDQTSPQPVTGMEEKVVQVSCGWRHTVALTEGRNVFAWGRATSGQLGVGDTVDRNTPTLVAALSRDGDACRHISAPPSAVAAPEEGAGASQGYVAPTERYALVPGQKEAAVGDEANVPDTDMKRLRIGG